MTSRYQRWSHSDQGKGRSPVRFKLRLKPLQTSIRSVLHATKEKFVQPLVDPLADILRMPSGPDGKQIGTASEPKHPRRGWRVTTCKMLADFASICFSATRIHNILNTDPLISTAMPLSVDAYSTQLQNGSNKKFTFLFMITRSYKLDARRCHPTKWLIGKV